MKKSLETAKVFFVFTSKSFYLLKLESFGYKQEKIILINSNNFFKIIDVRN